VIDATRNFPVPKSVVELSPSPKSRRAEARDEVSALHPVTKTVGDEARPPLFLTGSPDSPPLSQAYAGGMPGARKQVSPLGKVVAGVCAAVLAIILNSAMWSAIALAFEPPAIVFLVGGLTTLGVITAGLYTWAVDGPIRWRSQATSRR
jgi:hypothetical protein